jgi:hypothetical protein
VAGGRVSGVVNALGNRHGFYAMLVAFIAVSSAAPALLPLLMIVVAAGSHAYWLSRVWYRVRGADR